jgi:hypothetical protein
MQTGELLIDKADGIYSYRSDWKGYFTVLAYYHYLVYVEGNRLHNADSERFF